MSRTSAVRYQADASLMERIVSESAHLFAVRGYEGTSIRDVMSALNATAPVIYNRFSSKEELYNFVCAEKFGTFLEAVAWRLNQVPPSERSCSCFAGIIFDLLVEDPDTYYLINRNMVGVEPKEACSEIRSVYLRLRGLIDETVHFSDHLNSLELASSFDAVVCGYVNFALANNVPSARQEHIDSCRENLRSFVARAFP